MAVKTPEQIAEAEREALERLRRLLEFDRLLLSEPRKKSPEILIGTDEVGRGCLAGPVVAAAVVMPSIDEQLAARVCGLNDSKQVTPETRAKLSEVLHGVCTYAIAEASVAEVDELNVLQASLLAMRRAVRRLKVSAPALIIVDGNKKIKSLRLEQVTVVEGDAKSASVAAASIIAKVYRDRLMIRLSKKHPQYDWQANKGYRSRDHWKAIREFGMTRWHRRSFVERWLTAGADEDALDALDGLTELF